jgi:hypothetical protein
VLFTHISAGQHAAAKGGVGNDRYSKFTASFQKSNLVILYVQEEGRVFNLQGGDGMHGVRAAKCGFAALRNAYIADLSFPVMERQCALVLNYDWIIQT